MHAATSINGVTQTYDDNGNLLTTSAGVINTWSYRNELLSSDQGGNTTTFTYDHAGQRIKKTSPTGIVTYYPFSHYEVKDGSISTHLYLGDRLLATRDAGTLTDVHTDHLGSTQVVTNDQGELEQVLAYYPYGGIETDVTYGQSSNSNRYTGHDYDEETDLNYMKARYQDGETARFLSQDPASLYLGNQDWGERHGRELLAFQADPQLLNTYGYARNNPITYNDPTGELAARSLLPLVSTALTSTIRLIGAASVGHDVYEVADIYFNTEEYTNDELQNAAVNSSYNVAEHTASQAIPNHKISLVVDGLIAARDAIDLLNGSSLTDEQPQSFYERTLETANEVNEQREGSTQQSADLEDNE